ncbi:unnamed protein product [Bursaphelenchus okinawaensis]|uniref:WD_REPEATS_REGION domain-containing protein n=1 Tax=Bursaphelenchus okinawaensis TaxID=465554 RepID=A0A811LDT9_9BILA|nr:unnamed protein product [Bursaphelenchus okinawaensis]CAG9121380.1 unnamed protein product [Bursaphelenchus okinawaensis]
MANKPEFLLISSQSESPYTTSYVDPATGHAIWSHKGNELRGSATKFAEPVGRKGDVLLVGSATQNLVSMVSAAKFQPINCFVRSPVTSCAIDSTGTFVYLSLQNKIFSYNVKTGELLKVSANSMLRFNRIVLCPNDKYMAVPAEDDGVVFVFQTRDLVLRSVLAEEVSPYKTLRYHRQPVTDLSFGPLDSTRLLTVSADHSLVLWSIKEETPVIKMNVDEKLGACCLNSTELKLFFGTEGGKLISMSTEAARYQLAENDFLRAQKTDEEDDSLQIVSKHSAPIVKIALNLDESKGASGDETGTIYIWDSFNLQTMFKVQKSGIITTLKFTPAFKSVTDVEYYVDPQQVKPLNRDMSAKLNSTLTFRLNEDGQWNQRVEDLSDWLKSNDIPSTSSTLSTAQKQDQNRSKNPQQSTTAPLKTLSKSARRKLAKQKRQAIEEEPEIMEVDVEKETVSSEEVAQMKAELEKLKELNSTLQRENKKLFDFAKKQLNGE